MSHDVIIFILQILILTGFFIIGRYINSNKVSEETFSDITAKINLIIGYADAFVSWAKQFMSKNTGEEKMNEVVNQLSIIAKRYNLDISETEIKAIAQKAYDSMKNKEESSKDDDK